MAYLFMDTETTGLPVRNGPLHMQPHIIQLAFSLYDEEMRPLFELSTLVQPMEGVTMSAETEAIHGISLEKAINYGLPLSSALNLFNYAAKRAHTVIAHNMFFDRGRLFDAGKRADIRIELPNPFCTMEAMKPIINLPPTPKMLAAGFNKPKPPSLMESYVYFYGKEFEKAHDALVDTRRCADVFFKMCQYGLIPAKDGQ